MEATMHISYIYIVVFISLIISALAIGHKLTYNVIFLLSGLLIGIICYKKQINDYEYFSTTFCNQSYDLIATVIDKQCIENSYQKEYLKLSINELYNLNSKQTIRHSITGIAYFASKMDDIEIGDTIKLTTVFLKKSSNTMLNFHFLKEGVYATFFVNTIPTILYHPPYSLYRSFFNKKQQLLTALRKKMSLSCYMLFSTLFLGNKTENKKHFGVIKEQFKRWGLSHYLARSGLHLIIFLLIFIFIARYIPIAGTIKSCVLSALCIIYALFSWSSISFIRALLMYLLYCVYLFFNVQINILHLLCLITSIILLINPVQLFFLDFQLSFGLTFALILMNHIKTNKSKMTHLLPQ